MRWLLCKWTGELACLGEGACGATPRIRQLVQTAKARFTTLKKWQPGDPLGLDGLEHEQISREALPGVCDIISARLLERKASEKPLAPSPDDAAV